MQTEGSEVVRSMAADTRGKHRISAALKRLEQEAHSLEVFLLFNFMILIYFYFYFLLHGFFAFDCDFI